MLSYHEASLKGNACLSLHFAPTFADKIDWGLRQPVRATSLPAPTGLTRLPRGPQGALREQQVVVVRLYPLRRNAPDDVSRPDVFRDDRVGADDRVVAHGQLAYHLRPRAYPHPVSQRWRNLAVPEADRDLLVDPAVVADLPGAHDGGKPMLYEQVPSDVLGGQVQGLHRGKQNADEPSDEVMAAARYWACRTPPPSTLYDG